MQTLLETELLLYNTASKAESDWDFSAALVDYFDFMSKDGIMLFAHLHKAAAKRNQREEDIQQMYVELHTGLQDAHKALEKIVKCIGLEKDPIIEDRMRSFQHHIKEAARPDKYSSIMLEFSDVLRELVRHGHEDEITDFIESSKRPLAEFSYYDIKLQQELQKCKEVFDLFLKEDALTLEGAFVWLLRTYGELKRKERPPVSAKIHKSNLERVHNSIIINNPRQKLPETKQVKIFEIKNDDIHHHEIGKLVYELNGDKIPKYITLFKNIVAYMPEDKIKLRISEFEKHLPKEEQFGAVYRGNLGKSAASFQNFLKENGVKNIHPVSKQPILAVTDEYITFRNIL